MSTRPIYPEHLGDGIYASYDGYQIWLKARRTSVFGEEVWHAIALDPEAMQALIVYADRIREALEAEDERPSEEERP